MISPLVGGVYPEVVCLLATIAFKLSTLLRWSPYRFIWLLATCQLWAPPSSGGKAHWDESGWKWHSASQSSERVFGRDQCLVKTSASIARLVACLFKRRLQDPDNLWEWRAQLANAMDAENPKLKELEQQRDRLREDLNSKREALDRLETHVMPV